MTRVVERLRTSLKVVAAVLAVGLITAITLGIVLRPPAPVGYAAVEGQPLLHRAGAGPTAPSRPVRFQQHAIGIGIRCNGRGTLRIELHPFGAVESPCSDHDTSNGGYVLSDIVGSTTTRWQVKTRATNRWSLVLTQPVNDGASWTP